MLFSFANGRAAALRMPTLDVIRGGLVATIDIEMFVKQNYASSNEGIFDG